jgi:aryl-alcohol dehydrogenase-like predicted oxidoreductase
LGKWFKRSGKRDKIFLATKYGYKGNPLNHTVDSSPEYTKKACERALKTLGTDYIDLCKLGFPITDFSMCLCEEYIHV